MRSDLNIRFKRIHTAFYNYILKIIYRYKNSVHVTTNELDFWNKARIPTEQNYNILNQIKKLHSKWVGIKTNSTRQTETHVMRVHHFVNNCLIP